VALIDTDITWVSETNDGIIIYTSGFSLQVYIVNICKSKKTILSLQMCMHVMKHSRNVDKCNCHECYSPQRSRSIQ